MVTRPIPPHDGFDHRAVSTPPPTSQPLRTGQQRLDPSSRLIGKHTSTRHTEIMEQLMIKIRETQSVVLH